MYSIIVLMSQNVHYNYYLKNRVNVYAVYTNCLTFIKQRLFINLTKLFYYFGFYANADFYLVKNHSIVLP